MAVFWGLGGLLASVALTYVGEYGGKGPLFIVSSALFGVAVLGFAFSRSLVLSAGFFVVAGVGFQTMVTVNTVIAQQVTPNRLLGRVMSLLWMAQGIARTSGVVIGAVGQLIGLPLLYPLIGALMLGIALLAALQRPLRPAQLTSPAGSAVYVAVAGLSAAWQASVPARASPHTSKASGRVSVSSAKMPFATSGS